jgi:chromate reductase
MTTIAVLVGSLREKSYNKSLAEALESVKPENLEFIYIDIHMPLYSEDIENAGMPSEILKVKEAVKGADGVLLVTPEYNRSIPGVFKNAIDWISRPYGQSSFYKKPVGIVGTSVDLVGTAYAQADLRRAMLFQNAKVLGQPEVYVNYANEVFDENGQVASERWLKNFREYMEAFGAWVEVEK